MPSDAADIQAHIAGVVANINSLEAEIDEAIGPAWNRGLPDELVRLDLAKTAVDALRFQLKVLIDLAARQDVPLTKTELKYGSN